MDNDSGHDSVDSLHTPVDERERIDHLASAVAWIRQEVVSVTVHDRTSPTHAEGVATGSTYNSMWWQLVALLSGVCTPSHGSWKVSSVANVFSDCGRQEEHAGKAYSHSK